MGAKMKKNELPKFVAAPPQAKRKSKGGRKGRRSKNIPLETSIPSLVTITVEEETETEPSPIEQPPEETGCEAAARLGLHELEIPGSYFFKQRGTFNFEDYLTLKREEIDGEVKYKAARKIQASWRGFITRFKMLILQEAALKIQAGIRGFLGRRRVARIRKVKALVNDMELRNASASKIQSAWRGYLSRKKKLDFKKYKKIQEQNASLSRSIETINQLENSLESGDIAEIEISPNISGTRVDELYQYALRKSLDPCASTKMSAFRMDSIDDFFPEFPQRDGIVQPNSEKVQALKMALRLLREQIKASQVKKKQKHHYLLRTTVQPGVYSDIYCPELTEFEKELKSIKYWSPPPDPRVRAPSIRKQQKSVNDSPLENKISQEIDGGDEDDGSIVIDEAIRAMNIEVSMSALGKVE